MTLVVRFVEIRDMLVMRGYLDQSYEIDLAEETDTSTLSCPSGHDELVFHDYAVCRYCRTTCKLRLRAEFQMEFLTLP